MTKPITLQSLQECMAEGLDAGRVDDPTARRLWWAALETIQAEVLLADGEAPAGVWIAAPLPALYDPGLLETMQGWVWTPDELHWTTGQKGALLPPERFSGSTEGKTQTKPPYQRLSLLESDGLDPLLIVITAELQVALALHGESDQRQLLMRCDPETLSTLLAMLDQRLQDQAAEEAMGAATLQSLTELQLARACGLRYGLACLTVQAYVLKSTPVGHERVRSHSLPGTPY